MPDWLWIVVIVGLGALALLCLCIMLVCEFNLWRKRRARRRGRQGYLIDGRQEDGMQTERSWWGPH